LSEKLIKWFNEKYNTSMVFRRFIQINIFIWIEMILVLIFAQVISWLVPPVVTVSLCSIFLIEVVVILLTMDGKKHGHA
jgi:cobalamin biosynthesis protein CobD/CbiB